MNYYIMSNKELHFWNKWHLGDHIFNCIYFYSIKDYIEKENIKIFYYIPDIYLYQVSEFIPSENIILSSINEHRGTNIWIGCDDYDYNWFKYSKSNECSGFDIFLLNFFNKFSEKIKIPIKMNEFKYMDNELLLRYEALPEIYKDIDILIINSQPLSGQVDMTMNFINDMYLTINELNKKYKIVTTKKIEGINCTLDNNYTIKTIAAISTKAKMIICINTGPIVGLFNGFTLNNCKIIYYIDKTNTYSNNKFKKINYFSECNVENFI